MRYLLYDTSKRFVQKLRSSLDGEVVEPSAKKGFQPLSATPQFVKSFQKILTGTKDFSSLRFCFSFLSRETNDEKETEISHDYGRSHHHSYLTASKSETKWATWSEKISILRFRDNCAITQQLEDGNYSIAIAVFTKIFQKYEILSRCPTNQGNLSILNHVKPTQC